MFFFPSHPARTLVIPCEELPEVFLMTRKCVWTPPFLRLPANKTRVKVKVTFFQTANVHET